MSNLKKTWSKPGVVRRRLYDDEWQAVTNLVKARELLLDGECQVRDRVNRLIEANLSCKTCGRDSKETKAAFIFTAEAVKAQRAISSALDAYGAKHLGPWDLLDLEDVAEKTASQDGLCGEIASGDDPQHPPKREEV